MPRPWRCFHCDEVFHTEFSAAVHFGVSESTQRAGCVVKREERSLLHALRQAEQERDELRVRLAARLAGGDQELEDDAVKRWRATRTVTISGEPIIPTHLDWAVGRWRAEVANRPLQNVHRRSDDVTLCGPPHDDLCGAARSPGADTQKGDDDGAR